ncbi:MAG: zinc-dependent alcohol dehydrogenase [Christensenellales bacterium]|jgi:L-iditol 2-dehydrogenase
MKALVMEQYKQFVYKDVETPSPGAGEVLIRVKAVAVCGSDLHGIDGSTGRRQPPVIMGHEGSGIIEKCGEGVKDYKPGDRVTFDSTIYCNTCSACKAGKVNLCKTRRILGVSSDEYNMPGAFAEYLVVPEYVLYRLPDAVSYTEAAMVEPLSVAYHAATRTSVPAGGIGMVVGVGTIGLLTQQVIASMGLTNIIAVDIDDKRLKTAKENGAMHCINSTDPNALQQILDITGGEGVDIAYDATGIEDTVNLCLNALKLDGAVVLIGNLSQRIGFPLQWVVTRQQSLFGSCASAGEYDQCLELIAEGKVDVASMISKTVPLSEGGEWILRQYNREPGLYKLVLLP